MPQRFTMEEVSRHNTCDDFWTVFDNNVYDLSGYTRKHPGGSLLMAAAGCDGTVLFHQYHLAPTAAIGKLLERRRIGSLDVPTSPVMGAFYQDLVKEADQALKGLPPRPTAARVLFFIDFAAVFLLTLVGVFGVSPASNVFLLFALCFSLEVFAVRLAGQCHAVGHLQVFGHKGAVLAELALLAFGGRTMPVYGFPTEKDKLRGWMHLPRAKAQYEHFRARGPYEHQALHHVSGADLTHDQCYGMASLGGMMRLSPRQAMRPIHHLQRWAWGRALTHAIFTLVLLTFYPIYKLGHIVTLMRRPSPDLRLVAATTIGVVFEAFIAYVVVVLPLLASPFLFVALMVARRLFNPYLTLFLAQHVWDSDVTEAQANTDWGRHNCETNVTLFGRDMVRFPFNWGQGGANPSTLTYHTEHTLFPGVCYLYLPRLAPVVARVAARHGVTYHAYSSHASFRRFIDENLRGHAAPSAPSPSQGSPYQGAA